ERTKNLRGLGRDGIVTRTVFPEIPPRVEYRLTECGRTAFPVLEAISSWGRQYQKTRRESSHTKESP
ncbi:helix-turn-helix domain-containing protein, partial [Methanoregula sp.]|uniref:winged helix-turn-helix transcriptional regulator n=1 Tax=Methanoregula sp. TaxID=2052170 RepID=UPI000CC6F7E5